MKSAWQSTSATHNDTAPSKPARLSLSLACVLALAGVITLPTEVRGNPISWNSNWGVNGGYTNNPYGYKLTGTGQKWTNHVTYNDTGRSNLELNNVNGRDLNVSGTRGGWLNIRLVDTTFNLPGVSRANISGNVMVDLKATGGNNIIREVNNTANRVSLNADQGGSITVGTFNQSNENSELVIQNASGSVVIGTLNQGGGNVYQRSEEVTTANITGGHYYQGYGPTGGSSFGPSGDGGQIGTLNLQGGAFTQYAGQITDVNQSG
uniref:hypothetical protein n=1 Tax=Helicobacter sp. TaxID=218 RepID=UPI00388D08D0